MRKTRRKRRDYRKGLKTSYLGYSFRSRLEARWATFFQGLGLDFMYEPKGFRLPSGNYLPDFYLPSVGKGLWVEVKFRQLSKREEKLAEELVHKTKRPLLVARGDPSVTDPVGDKYEIYLASGSWDSSYCWCVCPSCGRVGVEHGGRSARIGCPCTIEQKLLACGDSTGHDDKIYTYDHPKVVAAVEKARGERFGIHD